MEPNQVTALIVSTQPGLNEKVPSQAGSPLAPIAGKAIVSWIADAVVSASVRRIGIVAHDVEATDRAELLGRSDSAAIHIVAPRADLTESVIDALSRLSPELALSDAAQLLLLPAEAPHIDPAELRALIMGHREARNDATLLATAVGTRTDTIIQRDDAGEITSIHDVVVGGFAALMVRASLLIPAMRRASENSWEAGVPIREIAGLLEQLGHRVEVREPTTVLETITSLSDRSPIEMELRDRITNGWIERGVFMPDPRQVAIDATVSIGQGVQVLPGSIIEGHTVIADGATIGPNSHLIDATIGAGATVPHSVVKQFDVAARADVTPFSILGSKSR